MYLYIKEFLSSSKLSRQNQNCPNKHHEQLLSAVIDASGSHFLLFSLKQIRANLDCCIPLLWYPSDPFSVSLNFKSATKITKLQMWFGLIDNDALIEKDERDLMQSNVILMNS